MRNILHQQPESQCSGRMLYSVSGFVDVLDIANKEILDIGCGFGWFELWALKNEVKEIQAMETNERNLETVRNNIDDSRIHFLIGSAEALPSLLGAATFDTVVAWEVIEHIPRHREMDMFKEIARVLRPGGVLYLSTPYDSFLSKVLDPAWWLFAHRHYAELQLSEFATEAGFTVQKMSLKGDWWELLTVLNLYIAKWVFHRVPFYDDFFTKKRNDEYQKPTGRALVFMKCKLVC